MQVEYITLPVQKFYNLLFNLQH